MTSTPLFMKTPLVVTRLLNRVIDCAESRRALSWGWLPLVASNVSGLAISLYVSRRFGGEGMGVYALIQSLIINIGFALSLGFSVVLVKEVAGLKNDRERLVFSSMIRALIGFYFLMIPVLIFSSSTLARWMLLESVSPAVLAGCVALGVFYSSTTVFNGVLQGMGLFKEAAVASSAGSLGSLIFAGIGGLGGPSYICLGWAAGYFLSSMIMFYEVCQRFPVGGTLGLYRDGAVAVVKLFIRSGVPVMLGGLVVSPVLLLCNRMIVAADPSCSQLGYFSLGMQWSIAVLFIPNMISQSMFPVMTKKFSLGDYLGANKTFRVMLLTALTAVVLVAGTLALFAGPLLSVYGPAFAGALMSFRIIMFSTLLAGVAAPVGQLLSAHGAYWTGFLINFIWGVNLLALTYFCARYGATGAGSARLLAYGIHLVVSGVVAYVLIRRMASGTTVRGGEGTLL